MKTLKELIIEAREIFLAQRAIAIEIDPERGEKIWLKNLRETLDDDIARFNGLPFGLRINTEAGAYQVAGRKLLKELEVK